jgi:peptidoglycan/LPS O-acetylase OafA/YrhL
MTNTITSPFAWWNARRLRYNIALVVAGILAFVAYVTVCVTLLPKDADVEITIFTTLFQGIGYLFMIGVANVCYFIGPLSERFVRPAEPERYRLICYRLGLWFSVLLPFSIPALLTFLALFHPTYLSHSL